MTHMAISFCILLFYMLLRNVMVFDKELAILYGFFNLRIFKKTTLLKKIPNGAQNIFLNFCLILYQNEYSYFWSHPKIPFKIRTFGHFSAFLITSSHSHLTQMNHFWFVKSYKLLIIFQIWVRFHFIWLIFQIFYPLCMNLTSIKKPMKNGVNEISKTSLYTYFT